MKWFEKYHIERVLIICSEGIYVPVAFVPEKLLPYKGVTFSEYNRKASIICPKNELLNIKLLLNIMRKTEKGRQTEGHTNRQTERQKMKEKTHLQ